jgi:hypothetical protein
MTTTATLPAPSPASVQVRSSLFARYHTKDGTAREIVLLTRTPRRVLVDRDTLTRTDQQVLAVLSPEESVENARLVCQHYLADPHKGRSRRLAAADLLPAPDADSDDVDVTQTLTDQIGRRYQLRTLDHGDRLQLRWVASPPDQHSGPEQPVTLREVIGRCESYEPACAITAAVLAATHPERCHTSDVRKELRLVRETSIVLNRLLRETVLQRVTAGESMSEIAMRCGRVKKDQRDGRVAGETSWLARRIGLRPDSTTKRPTPWMHIDVLALIAREGLGIDPLEVEL